MQHLILLSSKNDNYNCERQNAAVFNAQSDQSNESNHEICVEYIECLQKVATFILFYKSSTYSGMLKLLLYCISIILCFTKLPFTQIHPTHFNHLLQLQKVCNFKLAFVHQWLYPVNCGLHFLCKILLLQYRRSQAINHYLLFLSFQSRPHCCYY